MYLVPPGKSLKNASIQRPGLSHPRHKLRMISVRIVGIWMDENAGYGHKCAVKRDKNDVIVQI